MHGVPGQFLARRQKQLLPRHTVAAIRAGRAEQRTFLEHIGFNQHAAQSKPNRVRQPDMAAESRNNEDKDLADRQLCNHRKKRVPAVETFESGRRSSNLAALRKRAGVNVFALAQLPNAHHALEQGLVRMAAFIDEA
jgi:hypothetical protein